MADKSVDGVTFSAAFLDSGEADRQRIADEVQAEIKAKLAQAIARPPNGGAYTADGPAPPVQGALPMPPGFGGDMARFIYPSALLPVPVVTITAALGVLGGISGKGWWTTCAG